MYNKLNRATDAKDPNNCCVKKIATYLLSIYIKKLLSFHWRNLLGAMVKIKEKGFLDGAGCTYPTPTLPMNNHTKQNMKTQ